MSLSLIAGPPRSGRAAVVLERFAADIDRGAFLLAPTRDDVDRLERDLCARPGGLLGGTVTSFPRLFEEVARATGIAPRPSLSRMQRVWLARAATRRRQPQLRQLRRSAVREGFAPALENVLTDLQAAGLDSAAFAGLVADLPDAGYEREVAGLFGAYEELRDRLGFEDEHRLATRATTALRATPAVWGERPVYLYGFDDLSREQVELLDALASACEVTVALTFEDRPALAARAELLGTLRDELGGTVVEATSAGNEPAPPTLAHLERNLFEPEATTIEPADGSLAFLEGAGERGEAELIGRHVARLLAGGTDPDEIAIAVRSPDRQAGLIARILAGLGIPVAAEARIPLSATATGSTLLRLLAVAGGDGSAADFVAFLRGPARARPGAVDWLERAVLRGRVESATEALELWRERGREVWALDALAEAGESTGAWVAALSRIAADIAERPHLRAGTLPSSGPAVEIRAASEVALALSEAAALGELAPAPGELAELLANVRVPLWRGPTEGRVRILSPYRLRATRVSHLFVAGLLDGSFPSSGSADPLLSDERRRALGLSARRNQTEEERYLFYSCVSRPEQRLHLSWSAGAEGSESTRSPFVDEVRDLLSPPPTPDVAGDPLEDELTERAGAEQVVPGPEDASSPRELARALAVLGSAAAARAASLRLPAGVAAAALAEIDAAQAAVDAARAPGPLSAPEVLAELGGRDPFGASTLEEYDLCSYRWFVGHELRPRPLGPDPEPLETGGIAHAALERLYTTPPAEPGRPQTDNVARWIERSRELLREVAVERGWEPGSASARISLARLDGAIERFLRRDAETGGPLMPDPKLLEARFGFDEDSDFPAAELGEFRLHGAIDRIDVEPGGNRALIRDYKLSSKVFPAAKFLEEGKLQIPLYMLAVRGFGMEPIGGLYSPLAAGKDDRPRGMLDKEQRDELLPAAAHAHVRNDFLDEDDFEKLLDEGLERATTAVRGIRGGTIARNPRGGSCPRWCSFASICRVERGLPPAEDEEDERYE